MNEATPVEQKLLPRKIASLHDMVKEAMKEHSPERRYKPHAKGWRVEGKKIRSVKQMRAVVSAGDNPYPRKPMMRRQYCCLKKFWIAGSYLWFRWQSPETEEESQRRMKEIIDPHQRVQ